MDKGSPFKGLSEIVDAGSPRVAASFRISNDRDPNSTAWWLDVGCVEMSPVGDGVSLSMNVIRSEFGWKAGSNRSELPFLDDVAPAASHICIVLSLA